MFALHDFDARNSFHYAIAVSGPQQCSRLTRRNYFLRMCNHVGNFCARLDLIRCIMGKRNKFDWFAFEWTAVDQIIIMTLGRQTGNEWMNDALTFIHTYFSGKQWMLTSFSVSGTTESLLLLVLMLTEPIWVWKWEIKIGMVRIFSFHFVDVWMWSSYCEVLAPECS